MADDKRCGNCANFREEGRCGGMPFIMEKVRENSLPCSVWKPKEQPKMFWRDEVTEGTLAQSDDLGCNWLPDKLGRCQTCDDCEEAEKTNCGDWAFACPVAVQRMAALLDKLTVRERRHEQAQAGPRPVRRVRVRGGGASGRLRDRRLDEYLLPERRVRAAGACVRMGLQDGSEVGFG